MLKHTRGINSRRFIHDFAWLSIEKIVLEKFWEKITDTCAFFMVVWCQTHYQTLSTRKNWLLCVQNTLLAFFHTGPTKRIEKKSRRIEKVRRIKIYTGIEKKGAFLLPKIEISPSNPTSEKIIASFKVFSWFDTIIYQKIEKVSQKKYFLNDFTSNHPIATQIPDLIKF